MPKGNNVHNVRDCSGCGKPIIDVMDEWTGAAYPVDAVPVEGMTLSPPPAGKRNSIAVRGDIYVPHAQTCTQQELEEPEAEEGGEAT